MKRIVAVGLAALACCGTRGAAQVYIGPGSTLPGDYLRGVGSAAWGLGVYNLLSARAMSVNVETTIRWNQYVADVVAWENEKNAEHRAQFHAHRRLMYAEIQKRIKENPEERDVMIGDALNALMDNLRSPQIEPGSLRSGNLRIPADSIRRIHFRIDRRNMGFSMYRLSPKGKGKWPVGLRDARLDKERLAYEKAFDRALEEQIERRTSNQTIDAVQAALAHLENAFDRLGLPTTDLRHKEARDLLREMRESYEMLKSHKAESVIAAIETYGGTTVADLKAFMQEHKLRFGPASDDSPEERRLYAELYETMKKQQEIAAPPARDEFQ